MIIVILKKYVEPIREYLRCRFEFFRPDPHEYSTTNNLTIIPVQREAYFLALNKYVTPGDKILDVGFGLGYGITILSINASSVAGIDVDRNCVDYCKGALIDRNPKITTLAHYDGKIIPFERNSFDIVTCIDVLEHVKDYNEFLSELMRVAQKGVFISTPNRRPEFTNKDGTPKNYWHLREWNYDELKDIVSKFGVLEWIFINGNWEGPFTFSQKVHEDTQALTIFIRKK